MFQIVLLLKRTVNNESRPCPIVVRRLGFRGRISLSRRQGLKEPIDTDEGPKLLTQSLIDETLIISEIYNLDEIKTLELLWAAENHLPQYPGLTRGLGTVSQIKCPVPSGGLPRLTQEP